MDRLRDLARSASRPASDPITADPECVIFADIAEMLACLASDWCDGNVLTRWWWRSLMRKGGAWQTVKELWRRTPEYVPAALQHLAARRKVVDFVRTFDNAEVHDLLGAVARSFALYSLIPVLEDFQAPITAGPVGGPQDIKVKNIAGRPATDHYLEMRVEAPWSAWVPESADARLGPAHKLFLGVVLMLERAPVNVRAADFGNKVRVWQQQVLSALGQAEAVVTFATADKTLASVLAQPSFHVSPPQPVQSQRRVPEDKAKPEFFTTAAPPLTETFESETSLHAEAESIDLGLTTHDRREIRANETHDQIQQGDLSLSHEDAEPLTVPGFVERVQQTMPGVAASREHADSFKSQPITKVSQKLERDAGTAKLNEVSLSRGDNVSPPPDTISFAFETTEANWIETQLGGVFYLINVGIFLGLYGDFTSPGEPGLELSIWDFVSLIGSRLTGEDFHSDPVWELLARLAQPEEERSPGSGFDPEDEWRLSPEWLKPFARETSLPWRWSASGARLHLFHPAGFTVLDVLRNASAAKLSNPETQLEQELKAYESFGLHVSQFELIGVPTRETQFETRPSKLEEWLERMLPYLRARLRKALGLATTDDPGPLLCGQPASVCVTPTHVDLFFQLARLPIEIRMAGLDRNPGWVPAAGRFITFHFE
jgi:hypothetical protein